MQTQHLNLLMMEVMKKDLLSATLMAYHIIAT